MIFIIGNFFLNKLLFLILKCQNICSIFCINLKMFRCSINAYNMFQHYTNFLYLCRYWTISFFHNINFSKRNIDIINGSPSFKNVFLQHISIFLIETSIKLKTQMETSIFILIVSQKLPFFRTQITHHTTTQLILLS